MFETPRLLIRQWEPGDAEAAFRMYGDPEVTRFLGDGRVTDSLDVMRTNLQKLIDRYALWEDRMGSWPMIEKDSGELVGTAILKPIPFSDSFSERPDTEDIEIGWHLAKQFWGRGFATEGSRAVLTYAIEVLQLSRVVAVVYPQNTRSIRVAEKLEMTPLGLTDRYYNAELLHFAKSRPEV